MRRDPLRCFTSVIHQRREDPVKGGTLRGALRGDEL
jgi:hypothetical protein